MICKSPLFRVDCEKQPGIVYRLEHIPGFMRVNGGILGSGSQFASAGVKLTDLTPLPCGQCICCRLNYGRSWAVRMMCEAEYHEFNYFVTLTYDDRFLPRSVCYDLNTDSLKDTTLQPRDLQLFMKRLRARCHDEYGVDGVKFYACGEYGELLDRPHYHLCLFGMPDLSDRFEFLKRNNSVVHYTCDLIADAWRDPRSDISIGFHSICEFNYETAAYTGRYMTKKLKGLPFKLLHELDADVMAAAGGSIRYQPFARMSRRPGLGYDYFREHSFEILKTDSIPYQKDHKAFLAKSPRYFDKLFDDILPGMNDANKELRKKLGNARFIGLDNHEIMRIHENSATVAEINDNRRKLLS